ncbi:MAG: Ribosomal protein L10 [Chloroflexi bacterium]|jgi:large subunit ribosomal protein L10|nr:MAG: Ribosomal protein L10 [Chloroflexota bacterium]
MVKEFKVKAVEDLKDRLSRSSIAIGARFQGLTSQQLNDLRRRLAVQDVEFRVVRNTLALIAAREAGKTSVEVVFQGPTGVAFGYGDPIEPARILAEFIRSTRLPLEINGAFMESRTLSSDEVRTLATLPPKDQLIAILLGQMQAPIAQLLYVLNAPIQSLAIVLQRVVENGDGGSASENDSSASVEQSSEASEADSTEPEASVAEEVAAEAPAPQEEVASEAAPEEGVASEDVAEEAAEQEESGSAEAEEEEKSE